MPDYTPFNRAQSLIGQTPGGSQVYQNVLGQLNRQFGLRQRRQTMQGEQMNLPPHLRYAMSQQQFPELYGQYAGGLSRTATAAPGIDIQKAQSMASIQGQVEQLKLAHAQFEEQKRVQRQSEKTNFWDVAGMVGGMGLGVAGLMFPPALPATMAAGTALSAGTSMAGGGQPAGMQQFSGYGAGAPQGTMSGYGWNPYPYMPQNY